MKNYLAATAVALLFCTSVNADVAGGSDASDSAVGVDLAAKGAAVLVGAAVIQVIANSSGSSVTPNPGPGPGPGPTPTPSCDGADPLVGGVCTGTTITLTATGTGTGTATTTATVPVTFTYAPKVN